MFFVKRSLLFIIINGISCMQVNSLHLWPPDWWIPLSSEWYNGFEDQVTLNSLTPAENNISNVLQTIWKHQYMLFGSYRDFNETLILTMEHTKYELELKFNRQEIKCTRDQLRIAFVYFICDMFKINTTRYRFRPSFCPNVCNRQNPKLCGEFHSNHQKFRCQVLDSGLRKDQHKCSCANIKQKLMPRLKICADINSGIYTEKPMPMTMPQDPWSLVQTYRSKLKYGFPNNYSHDDIVYQHDNWVALSDAVSLNSYKYSFDSFRGTLYQKMLKVYSKCASIHNFNLQRQQLSSKRIKTSYSEITSEEYVLGLLLFACSEYKNQFETDISRILEICPNVCIGIDACSKNEMCRFSNQGMFLSDKICSCKPGYYKNAEGECINCLHSSTITNECLTPANQRKKEDLNGVDRKFERHNIIMRKREREYRSRFARGKSKIDYSKVWNAWSECSEKCGEGTQFRFKPCVQENSCEKSNTTHAIQKCSTYSFYCTYVFKALITLAVLFMIAVFLTIMYTARDKGSKMMRKGGNLTRNKERIEHLIRQKRLLKEAEEAKKAKEDKDAAGDNSDEKKKKKKPQRIRGKKAEEAEFKKKKKEAKEAKEGTSTKKKKRKKRKKRKKQKKKDSGSD